MKPKPKFDEHRVRNEFLKLIDNQPAKVQVRMCAMALLQVVHRVQNDVGFEEAMTDLTALVEMVEGLNMPSTREH